MVEWKENARRTEGDGDERNPATQHYAFGIPATIKQEVSTFMEAINAQPNKYKNKPI
jgi:hypothetical protein